MRTVLIATPLHEGAQSSYMVSFAAALQGNGGVPGWDIHTLFMQGPAINAKRNELGAQALRNYPDDAELVFVDEDMMDWHARLPRILSHDSSLGIVAGYYCKRKPGRPQWLFVPKRGAEQQPNGLLECAALATGFMRIPIGVLRRIAEANPDRRYTVQDTANAPVRVQTELFPMGVVGGGSAEWRLAEIRRILNEPTDENTLRRVTVAALGDRPPGHWLGEDYYFCKLARDAGVRLWVDLGMQALPHRGDIGFPITPEMVGFGAGVEQLLPPAEDF